MLWITFIWTLFFTFDQFCIFTLRISIIVITITILIFSISIFLTLTVVVFIILLYIIVNIKWININIKLIFLKSSNHPHLLFKIDTRAVCWTLRTVPFGAFFENIFNGFQPLTVFAKNFVYGVTEVSVYTSDNTFKN